MFSLLTPRDAAKIVAVAILFEFKPILSISWSITPQSHLLLHHHLHCYSQHPVVIHMDEVSNILLVHTTQRLILIVASDVFSVSTLNKEQMEVLLRLAMMKFQETPVVPASILLVKATVGEKSLVPDINYVIFAVYRYDSTSPCTWHRSNV